MYLLDAFQQLLLACFAEKQTNIHTHTDTGDFVIVINAEKVKLTGKKQLIRSTTLLKPPRWIEINLCWWTSF